VFGSYVPEFYKGDGVKLDESSEFHKVLYSNLPEQEDQRFKIENKEDAIFYEQYRQTAINYFKAKQQFISDQFENQIEITLKEFDTMAEKYTLEDKYMQSKLDFMYNSMDYDNDRLQIRKKYLKQMNKRVDLKDVGEMLDELVVENKAKHMQHYELREHHDKTAKRAS
jgi:hypothetical protein